MTSNPVSIRGDFEKIDRIIILLKVKDNPPMQLPSAAAIDAPGPPWWVAHTKARFEKAFAWDLHNQGMDYFLPMRQRVRMSGSRKRRVFEPLFTSYVFFRGGNEARYEAMRTHRLCQVIAPTEPDQLARELVMLDRALQGDAPLNPYPRLPIGSRGRVTQGPFLGTEGVVVERKDNRAQLVLQVRMLGQGAVIEIDSDLIEPIDD